MKITFAYGRKDATEVVDIIKPDANKPMGNNT